MYGEGATALTTDDSDDFRAIEQGSVSKPRAYLRIRAVPAVGFFLQTRGRRSQKLIRQKSFYRVSALGILTLSPTGRRKRSCKIQRINGL